MSLITKPAAQPAVLAAPKPADPAATAAPATAAAAPRRGRVGRIAARHPIAAFLLMAYPVGWATLFAASVAGLNIEAAVSAATFVGLLGPAALVTYWSDGPAGVRRLFAGVLRWRIGAGRYLYALAAVPVVTLALATATGTFPHPAGGWIHLVYMYVPAMVIGAVFTNIWEETAWAGVVQSRLMARRGLIVASIVTAPLFIAQHLPFLLDGHGLVEFAVVTVVLVVAAIFFRYLVGAMLVDTGGSLLAVGLLHASFDASGLLVKNSGYWQQFAAGAVLAVIVFGYRKVRDRRDARS